MWEQVIAGAGGLVGLYVALRHEVRRRHELLQKDFGHLDTRLTELRADFGRLDQKVDAVRGELIGFLGSR